MSDDQSELALDVKNLKLSFFTKQGEIKAVNDISYSVRKGKITGIVGESGCGKSVTSGALMGLIENPGRIIGGEILLNGQNVVGLSEDSYSDIRGKKIAMIFQEPMTALNPVLTIGYQIKEQLRRHLNLEGAEAHDKATHLLDLVGIPSPEKRVKEFPHQLSGGMKQRAMIAMALSCDPDFLIADEPTTALDVTIQAQILELIGDMQERMGMSIQFITHDLGVISELADDIVVMYAGRIAEKGSAYEIFKNPKHPYTKGLLASLPHLNKHGEDLYSIPGQVPSPLELGKGCAFYNRCPYATEECLETLPEETKFQNGSSVACFHPLQ